MSSQNRTRWDAAQFLSTLNFFGEVPFLGSFRWLQEWLGQRPTFSGVDLSAMKQQVIVIGEITSEELVAVQQRLPTIELSQVSEEDVLTALSNAVETASHQSLHNQVVSADEIVIAKVNDFSKLVSQITPLLKKAEDKVCRPVFDFTQESADFAAWGSLDDVVMGGVSQGSLIRTVEATDGHDTSAGSQALFAGVISTSNSGGFSSVRTQNFEPPFNLSGYKGLRLQVKGDGQRYKFIARNSDGWDSPAYIYSFDTQADQWISVDVPFSELVATFRARSVPDATPFDPSRIFSFQLMLSKFEYDRQLNPSFSPGEFAIAIKRISAYIDRNHSVLIVVGDESEVTRGQQQTVLTESRIGYRFIEPTSTSQVDAIVSALK